MRSLFPKMETLSCSTAGNSQITPLIVVKAGPVPAWRLCPINEKTIWLSWRPIFTSLPVPPISGIPVRVQGFFPLSCGVDDRHSKLLKTTIGNESFMIRRQCRTTDVVNPLEAADFYNGPVPRRAAQDSPTEKPGCVRSTADVTNGRLQFWSQDFLGSEVCRLWKKQCLS